MDIFSKISAQKVSLESLQHCILSHSFRKKQNERENKNTVAPQKNTKIDKKETRNRSKMTIDIRTTKCLKIKAFFKKMNFDEKTCKEMYERLNGLTLDMIEKVIMIIMVSNLFLYQVIESTLAGIEILRMKKIKKKRKVKEATEFEWEKILAKSKKQDQKSKNYAFTLTAAQLVEINTEQLKVKKIARKSSHKVIAGSKRLC